MKYEARPYQTDITEYILAHPRCAIYAGMGLGKTVSTLTAVDKFLYRNIGPALVIAPLRVARSVWPDEVKKWDHLRYIKMIPILGNAKQRLAALHTPAHVYTINYENIPWLLSVLEPPWPFKIVVADESTRLKSFRLMQGGQRAQALAKVAYTGVEHFIELTGTPTPNGLQDLWGQVWFLDRGARLGTSFTAFVARWFRTIQVGEDRFAVKLEPHQHAQGEIQQRLADICLSLDARDWFDLHEPIVNVIKVDLPAKARAMYERMEEELFIELSGGEEIEAVNAAARTMKCLQLANGAIYTDVTASAWEDVHDAKIEALEDVVEEAAGMPVLVAYHFRSDLARLRRAFPQGRVLDAKPETIRDWNAGRIPVLFAHPASAGHGLNLQDGGNIIAFFGHWWDLEQYQQIVERIGPARQAQSGYDRPVFIHHIVARDTVDEAVLECRESKRGVQEVLLEALKRRVPA